MTQMKSGLFMTTTPLPGLITSARIVTKESTSLSNTFWPIKKKRIPYGSR